METIIYLLKVSACTVLFFAFYLLFLRRLTFFKFNRFYLLFTLLVSFIIPALNFTIEREVAEVVVAKEVPVIAQVETMVPLAQSLVQAPAVPIVKQSFDWNKVVSYLYFGVSGCLLALAIWRILQLIKHTRNRAEQINGLKVVAKTGGLTNCSFFNYVFVDNETLTAAELEVILKHEAVHANQLHSLDKLVLTVVKAFLWFNPVVYLFDKSLEQNHEYEADEATSLSFGTSQYANLLLRLAVVKSEIPLVHNFVKSPIKERIKMLFNPKSNHMKKLIYLLVLPVGLGLLWGFTVKIVNVAPKTDDEKNFTVVIDAGHGGAAKGAEMNGFTEKDITLTMANKIKTLAEASGIKVVTTRIADEDVSIKDRAKADGNILISLHVNSSPANRAAKANGMEIFISKDDGNQVKSAQAKLITQYLFKGIQHLKGITINGTPQQKGLALLRESKVPGVFVELGYLTNENDFKFITNQNKQNELAQGVVNGILAYKEGVLAEQEVATTPKAALPPQDVPNIKKKEVNKNAIKINKASNQTGQKVITSPEAYVVNKSPEVEHPTFSAAYQMLKDLKTANNSLELYNIGSRALVLSGEPNLNLDGYTLKAKVFQVNKDSNLITAHVATLISPNGTKVSGDVIQFNFGTKNYKVLKEIGSTY